MMNSIDKQNDFLKHNDIIIEKSDKNCSKVKLYITNKTLNPYGIVHGGLIFALGDTVMGVTCRSTGRDAVTLDANINFIKPGKGSFLLAVSEVVKMGKNTSVLKANIYNDKDELIAIMNSTYYFIN